MRRSSRVVASVLGLALTLTACGGHTGSLLPTTPGDTGGQAPDSGLRATVASLAETPLMVAPKTHGALAFTDEGRRGAHEPVSIVLTLRYNNQAELDRFTEEVATTHRFLTREQFSARFAPTRQQEQRVVDALTNAGFTITQRYSNRTLVDAKAPASAVERFFSTEMHNVHQGKYGERFVNIRPGVVPRNIAPLVRTASLSNIVVAQTVVDQEGGAINVHPAKPFPQKKLNAPSSELPIGMRPMASSCSGQLLLNPGFESGSADWNSDGDIWNYSSLAYQGNYFAWLGGYTSPGNADYDSQTVTIPAGCKATLSYELYIDTAEPSSLGAIDTLKVSVDGNVVQSFSNLNANNAYALRTVDVSSYAGGSANVAWTSAQGGYDETDFLLDNTSLTLSAGTSTPTPSPTASPTAKPTATPTAKPTATPTAGPTATPTAKPTATPTAKPTATPTTAPTATPTTAPTSSPSSGCNGAAALNGPLTNSSGTLATGIAKPFDFPSQHGCTGAGQTAAIVIDLPGTQSYVNTYLSAAGVTQTGTITWEAIDGGGSGDEAEADLDMETIAGLAPAANIIVYDAGSLADQNIEDAYNKILTDGKAQISSSSFGGCESEDTSFSTSTNSIAEQGASEGVTFNASSGDWGSGGDCSSGEGTDAPASGSYFQSIGGVNFTESSSGALETVAAGSDSGDAGGGGVSTVTALPSYQSGITGVITSGRNVPDISLPFDPVAVYTGGSWGEYLGTSWSNPQFGAFALEANQDHGSKLGQLDPTLYSLFKSSGYNTYFTPCTSGNNGAYSCSSTQYNQAAGIGVPKGWALAQAL